MNATASISRVLLYVRDPMKVSDFYSTHFGFIPRQKENDRIIELVAPTGGCSLLLHPASKGHKIGQSCIKLIFDVDDVEAFKKTSAKKGLLFGATHEGAGYCFSNARDPAKNPIQITNRPL